MKNIFKISLAIFGLAMLFTGDFVNFAMAFGLSAFMQKQGVAMATVFPCALAGLEEPDDCNTRGGLSTAYWAKESDIDWVAMAADALQFDHATQTIKDYTMVGSTKFTQIQFNRKGGSYNFTYTSDTQSYAQLIPMIFEGKTNANKLAIQNAISCCKVILHLFDNNGLERVVGIEWNGTKFTTQVLKLKIVRHLDASGTLAGEKAREELDLGGESAYAPLYATVGEANMPV